MCRLLIILSIAVYCEAGYGGYGGYGRGAGLAGLASLQPSYGSERIPAAIKSTRTVELQPVSLPQDPILPQILEVAPLELPIQIIYNSKSSPVLVQQNHIPGAPGQVERTSSKEEPHVVIHEVLRPVIQELREVITPYRRVVQEIAPVVETVNTIISKGEQRVVAAPQVAPAPKADVTSLASSLGSLGGYGSLTKSYLLSNYRKAAAAASAAKSA